MTVLGFLPHHRVEAVRAAACGREVKTGEAEQDRGGSTIDERKEYRRLDAALEHVTQEIGERHLAREYEGHRTREQPEHQQRAADQFDSASGVDQGWNIRKIRQHRKFEDLGDAILKQQQGGDKTKKAA